MSEIGLFVFFILCKEKAEIYEALYVNHNNSLDMPMHLRFN